MKEINTLIDPLYQDPQLAQFYDYDNPWSSSFDVLLTWAEEKKDDQLIILFSYV